VGVRGWCKIIHQTATQKLALAKAAGEPEEAHHKHQRFLLRGWARACANPSNAKDKGGGTSGKVKATRTWQLCSAGER